MSRNSRFLDNLGVYLLVAVFVLGLAASLEAFAAGSSSTLSTSVIVGNAAPIVSGVVLNNGSAITLTPGATTTIQINYIVSDNNGCADVFTSGAVSSTAWRFGVSAACATPSPTVNNLNCYGMVLANSTNSCTGSNLSANVTDTVYIYYFAQATDASSSYPLEHWEAFAYAKDGSNATGSATSTSVELNTLTAIDVTTSSVNYGTLSASSTSATSEMATSTNAGNSSTTLQVKASSTLVAAGIGSIATSSQHYATSSATLWDNSSALTDTLATVSGYLLTSPTTTALVAKQTFWRLNVPAGTATGTYSGANIFSSLFQP